MLRSVGLDLGKGWIKVVEISSDLKLHRLKEARNLLAVNKPEAIKNLVTAARKISSIDVILNHGEKSLSASSVPSVLRKEIDFIIKIILPLISSPLEGEDKSKEVKSSLGVEPSGLLNFHTPPSQRLCESALVSASIRDLKEAK
jgi:hypothetical protein